MQHNKSEIERYKVHDMSMKQQSDGFFCCVYVSYRIETSITDEHIRRTRHVDAKH
jgi:hypothetical protein